MVPQVCLKRLRLFSCLDWTMVLSKSLEMVYWWWSVGVEFNVSVRFSLPLYWGDFNFINIRDKDMNLRLNTLFDWRTVYGSNSLPVCLFVFKSICLPIQWSVQCFAWFLACISVIFVPWWCVKKDNLKKLKMVKIAIFSRGSHFQ